MRQEDTGKRKRPLSCDNSGGASFTLADHSQLIANTWLVHAIRGGFALVVPFGLSS